MKPSTALAPALMMLALAACGSGAEAPAADEPETGETLDTAAPAGEAVAAGEGTANTDPATAPGEPDPYASGRPGQPAIPETREDASWQSRYSPDIPYYNRSDRAIPATMGASPRTALVGKVEPGDGGFIETCEVNSTYCKISFGGGDKKGYVNMDLLRGEAN